MLATRYGKLALVRIALALLAAGLVRSLRTTPGAAQPTGLHPSRSSVRTAAAIAVGLAATITLAGHPTTGRWQALAIPADLIHVLAMSVWLGGLAIVLSVVLPMAHGDDAVTSMHRYSRLAAGAVAALVVTGALQSWRQVGHLSALDTDYGRALTWKLRIIVVLIATAALSRMAVRRWLAVSPAGDGDAFDGEAFEEQSFDEEESFDEVGSLRRRLRTTVVVEVVLAVAVLAVTAALVTTRPAYEVAGGPVSVTLVDHDTIATLTIDPARAGSNEMHLYVNTAGGALGQVLSVTVEASLPGRNIGPLPIAVDRTGPNHFTASSADLPIAGRWQISVLARVSEFVERTFTTTITVR